MDVNGDGVISFEEFLGFWETVKGCGHSEEEILQELENIEKGESWVGFDNLPKKYNPMSKQQSSSANKIM